MVPVVIERPPSCDIGGTAHPTAIHWLGPVYGKIIKCNRFAYKL